MGLDLEYDDGLGCVVIEGTPVEEFELWVGNKGQINRIQNTARSIEKFANGILRADEVGKRFDDGDKERDKKEFAVRRKDILHDHTTYDVYECGQAEWREEQKTLSKAHVLKAQGLHEPYRFENRIYADSLERWVKRHEPDTNI